jgi:hypothetical protein
MALASPALFAALPRFSLRFPQGPELELCRPLELGERTGLPSLALTDWVPAIPVA